MKVHIRIPQKDLREALDIPIEYTHQDRIIDLVVDVWGMAGPDCRTLPHKGEISIGAKEIIILGEG